MSSTGRVPVGAVHAASIAASMAGSARERGRPVASRVPGSAASAALHQLPGQPGRGRLGSQRLHEHAGHVDDRDAVPVPEQPDGPVEAHRVDCEREE